MSDAIPLTAYDRFVWRRLAEACRAWRDAPSSERIAEVQKLGRLAWKATLPFAEGDQRRAQAYALAHGAKDFAGLSFHARNEEWPAMAAGIAAIDGAVAPTVALVPPAPPPAERLVEDGLDAGKLPYWLE